jgi:hypothetical protein
MQALAASCEELRARTGNPPLDHILYKVLCRNPFVSIAKFWLKNLFKQTISKCEGQANNNTQTTVK